MRPSVPPRGQNGITRLRRAQWNPKWLFCVTLLCAAAFSSVCSGASTVTQSFTLQPGWNSIFLEVQPEDSKPASVFAGLPIDMVWAYFPTKTPLEYIQNPSEGLWNVPGWNVYLPPAKTDAAALTNLFAMSARRAYLVKISGTSAVTLNVTGVPLYGEIAWQPDGFTLTGFPLDPSTTVRFGDYFFSSP